ncbi:hypothetical protein C8R45DRAFT_162348 [Mycena sanguinolenta]|nr:hypothetical protein C8R45DRAFT_162348 [Mycena sanguinolenta]
MSASPIPHLVDFLTAPLSKSTASFPPTAVSTARLILAASLARVPRFETYTLRASDPPAPLLAASIGAGIPWPAWRATLRTGLGLGPGSPLFVTRDDLLRINLDELWKNDEIVVSFGPGNLCARAGAKDVWAWRDPRYVQSPALAAAALDMEDARGSVVPISHRFRSLHHVRGEDINGTTAGLRAPDLFAPAPARVQERDSEYDWHPIRIPRVPPFSSSPLAHPCFPVVESDSESDFEDSDSDADYCSDSTAATSVSSAFSPITENDTAPKSAASSPTTDNDAALTAKSYTAVAMVAPPARAQAPIASASKARSPAGKPAFASTFSLPAKPAAKPKAKTQPTTKHITPSSTPFRTPPVTVATAKTTPTTIAPTPRTPTTNAAYMYAGGVTRVVGGGVMLGPRPPRARVGGCAVLPGRS